MKHISLLFRSLRLRKIKYLARECLNICAMAIQTDCILSALGGCNLFKFALLLYSLKILQLQNGLMDFHEINFAISSNNCSILSMLNKVKKCILN